MWQQYWRASQPVTKPEPPNIPQPVDVWCQTCQQPTARDCLPGSKDFDIPDYWLCVRCGVVDWAFTPQPLEESA